MTLFVSQHVAASNGHMGIVKCILETLRMDAKNSKIEGNGDGNVIDFVKEVSPMDRWNHTPLDDAITEGHSLVAKRLRDEGALTGEELQSGTKPRDEELTKDLERIKLSVSEDLDVEEKPGAVRS